LASFDWFLKGKKLLTGIDGGIQKFLGEKFISVDEHLP
jgi:hypothetical protein